MGFFDFLKGTKQKPDNKSESNRQSLLGESEISNATSKEEIFKLLLQRRLQRPPSELFASGAVFDIFRQDRQVLYKIVQACDSMALKEWFILAYASYFTNPRAFGLLPHAADASKDDTELMQMNTDILSLVDGDKAALCFLPVKSDEVEARIIGIVLSENGDGYYYCMLAKDPGVSSEVRRNMARGGIKVVGEVKGRGFELIKAFMDCIKENFYS